MFTGQVASTLSFLSRTPGLWLFYLIFICAAGKRDGQQVGECIMLTMLQELHNGTDLPGDCLLLFLIQACDFSDNYLNRRFAILGCANMRILNISRYSVAIGDPLFWIRLSKVWQCSCEGDRLELVWYLWQKDKIWRINLRSD